MPKEAIPMPETITEVGLEELCGICHTTPDFVVTLIEYGTIEPRGYSAATWRFDSHQLQILRTAKRLHHDLEVNHAGIAVVMDLLQQIEELQAKVETFNKYFSED